MLWSSDAKALKSPLIHPTNLLNVQQLPTLMGLGSLLSRENPGVFCSIIAFAPNSMSISTIFQPPFQ